MFVCAQSNQYSAGAPVCDFFDFPYSVTCPLEELMSSTIPTINLNVNSAGFINTAFPSLSGTADPLTTVKILNNNGPTPLGTTTSDANGNWHWTETTALYNGIQYQLTAEAVDSSGHQLATSSAIAFRVDTVAPSAPVFASNAVNGVNAYGYVIGNTPGLIGDAEAGSTVNVFVDGVSSGTVTSTGHWSYSIQTPLRDGIHTVTADTVDLAGNLSALSNPFVFSVDTTPPAAPTLIEAQMAAGNVSPHLSGTSELHSTVQVFDGTTSLGVAPVDANGNWSIILDPLAAGNYILYAKATDSQTNVSVASTPVTFQVGNSVMMNGLLVMGSSASEHLEGGAGNDVITGNGGSDVIDGGAGVNTAVFSGPHTNFSISQTSTGYMVSDASGVTGTATITNIQRLQFSDSKIALDMGATQAGGETALILGAVFGPSSVQNKAFVGIGLGLLDGGMSFSDLTQLALNAAGVTTHAQEVNLLWTNLFGTAPTTDQAAPFVAMLDNGSLSTASLGVTAADLAINQSNVNSVLVGLHSTGVAYS